MKTVKVIYERGNDGWWTVTSPTVPGAITQGRTIEEARRNIRDAIGMFPEDGWTSTAAAKAELEEQIRLPGAARSAIDLVAEARAEAAAAEIRLRRVLHAAVRILTSAPLSLSTRDAAAFLGLSFQRVHQVLAWKDPSVRSRHFAAAAEGRSTYSTLRDPPSRSRAHRRLSKKR